MHEEKFIYACANNQLSVVKELLLDSTLDINARSKYGFTGFYLACANNYTHIVKELLNDPRLDINPFNRNCGYDIGNGEVKQLIDAYKMKKKEMEKEIKMKNKQIKILKNCFSYGFNHNTSKATQRTFIAGEIIEAESIINVEDCEFIKVRIPDSACGQWFSFHKDHVSISQYPILKTIRGKDPFTVLFTAPNTGIVLASFRKEMPVGEYSTTWGESMFEINPPQDSINIYN